MATEGGNVCPGCGEANRPQALMCRRCRRSFLGPRVDPPKEPTLWEQGVRAAPVVSGGRFAGLGSRKRSDSPLAFAGVVVALVALLSGALPLPVRTGPVGSITLGLLAVAMGVRGAGFHGFGVAAILIGGIVALFTTVLLVVVVHAQPSVVEPFPPPAGYGFVAERTPPGVHIYDSTTLRGDAAVARQAIPTVLAYYGARFIPPTWTVVKVDQYDIWVRRPGADDYLAITVSVSDTRWDGSTELPTLTLSITAVPCSDLICGSPAP